MAVVVPVRNNRHTLAELLSRTSSALDRLGRPSEIVVIDDCSVDGSWSIVTAAAAVDPRVNALRLGRRSGQMPALLEGVRASSSDFVICIDADLECPPEQIGTLLDRLTDGADIVSSVRRGSIVRPLHRRLLSWLERASLSPAARGLTDIGSGFKGWRRHVSEPLLDEWNRSHVAFVETMCARAARIDNVDVSWTPSARPSTYSSRDVLEIAADAVVRRAARFDLTDLIALGGTTALAVTLSDRSFRLSWGFAAGVAVAASGAAASRSASRRVRRDGSGGSMPPPAVVERVGSFLLVEPSETPPEPVPSDSVR